MTTPDLDARYPKPRSSNPYEQARRELHDDLIASADRRIAFWWGFTVGCTLISASVLLGAVL